mgnify:CR=1 FL=1
MRWLEKQWYRDDAAALVLRLLLWPFSLVFAALATLRCLAYRRGIFNTTRLPVPVVVVGNLSVGGTGKTPLTIALAEQLRRRGRHPGIVSRGYKGGGFQLDRSGMDPAAPALPQLRFRAETADSYEAGVKGATQDGRFRATVAAFHTQFHDYQFSYFTGLNRRTQNVPDLTTKGFEIETWFRPLEALEFSAAATYQETIFGRSGFPAGLTQLQGTTGPIAPRWIVVGKIGRAHVCTPVTSLSRMPSSA